MSQNVLLVSNQTDYVNWGARGASLALQQAIQAHFGNLQTLPGHYATRAIPVDFTFPKTISSPLVLRQHRNSLLRAYYKLEEMLGMKPDYIEDDPVQSVKNILENKRYRNIGDIYEKVYSADVVIVDGDGDLIFTTPARRIPKFNLAVIELAHQLGKEIHYVNSIFADCPVTGRNETLYKHAVATLSKCSTVAFRDPTSVQLARSASSNLDAEYVPDSLFLWYETLQDAAENLPANGDYVIPYTREHPSYYGRLRFDRPYVCIAGGSRAAKFEEDPTQHYVNLANEVYRTLDLNVILMPTCRGDRFMYKVAAETGIPIVPTETPVMMAGAIVANAELFITGRYHPAIMASFSGTPCIFLEADSHKTCSLQQILGYAEERMFSASPTEREREEICSLAIDYLQNKYRLCPQIRAAARECAQKARSLLQLIDGSSE